MSDSNIHNPHFHKNSNEAGSLAGNHVSTHSYIPNSTTDIFTNFPNSSDKTSLLSTTNGLSVSGTNNDYWVNSPTVETLVQKVEITPYAEATPPDEPIEVIGHGGGGGGVSGGMGGGIGGGTGNPGMGGGGDGGGGGEAPEVTTVHGVHAKLNSDGVLAIVDNQNEFVLRDRYHGDVNGRGYTVTVDSTVNDAEKAYSDIEDKPATDQQVTDYLQAVAAGKSYTDIRSDIINSPDMKAIMDGYEQQLYGVNADQNTQDWLKGNLQNERSLSDIRWEDAHSQRMTDAIFTMINGVQDRTDASEAYDANYKNSTMDALGHKETSFIQNRNNLINTPAENGRIDAYEQQLYGGNADQNTQSWVKDNLHNGRTMQDIRWEDAHSQRMANAIFTMINGVQDRTDASEAYDANYKNATMDALGRKETSFIQNRDSLIDIDAEKTIINDKIYETIHDRAATDGDISFVRNKMHSGNTIQQMIHDAAYSPEATTALTTVSTMVTGQTPSDATTLQQYQNAMANGGSLNDAIYNIAHSDQAKAQSSNFIAANIGQVTESLVNASETMLTNIAQAYQTVKNYSESQIQSAANGYHAASNYDPSLGNGLLLDKIMPTTWQGWLGFAPLLVMELTPPGELATATVLAAVGTEELLTAALDIGLEQDMTLFTSKAVISNVPETYTGAVKAFSEASPMKGGTTLQLNEDTIVTQTAATKYQKTVLDYTGANEAAVEEKFRELTGLTGPLDEAKVYEGSDGIVYTVEMPNQTVTLRTVSSSGKNWTIDLKNPLSNGVKRIKFSK